MRILINLFGTVLNSCYQLFGSYGLAVIVFTLLSKIVLIPVSIWVQLNSIKMVKIEPEINRIKINYFGDRDRIDDEQAALYKREKYHSFASIIPLVIQIVILLGLVYAIRDTLSVLPESERFFCGIDLSSVPAGVWGGTVLVPLSAALSSFLLCVIQNKNNVLLSGQSKFSQYGTMLFSVGLSLYLGFFVPAGVALYWIASNLLSIVQLYILNFFINPRKYVDYEALNSTRAELEKLNSLGGSRKSLFSKDPNRKKEKADYKRFFSVVNKHLVIYSESSGFYKYYAGFIDYLMEESNLTIHYVTSDANDNIFKLAEKNPRIRAYYIGELKLITLMLKLDADICMMTMPDLDNFHIKRSQVRKDIEYLYVPHDMNSHNLMMRKGCKDHYDTIFCTGPHQVEEMRLTEEAYHLPPKKLIECGYTLLDDMRRDYARSASSAKKNDVRTILISPSWQKDNIVDLCLTELLKELRGHGYSIIVRPHPQQVKLFPEKMQELKETFRNDDDIEIQTDFSSNTTVFSADIIITDWSGIALEYAYTTYHPVLFIDTPMKIMNPEYQKIDAVPLNIWIRDKIGKRIAPENIDTVLSAIQDMFAHEEEYRENIKRLSEEYTYNIGSAAKTGGDYILSSLQEKISQKKA
ncbi:MAG: membrane protein insertase YidC [Lachnospiraceae bacterium]|nr:membrane protein insertase YidC [Lachnospiraceae bacterium]